MGTGPALVLYDAAGAVKTMLSASEATSVLGLYGVDGKVRANLMVVVRDPALWMWSRDGKTAQVSMGVDSEEGGYLDLMGPAGNPLFSMP